MLLRTYSKISSSDALYYKLTHYIYRTSASQTDYQVTFSYLVMLMFHLEWGVEKAPQ
jgi:hypothetical protein